MEDALQMKVPKILQNHQKRAFMNQIAITLSVAINDWESAHLKDPLDFALT